MIKNELNEALKELYRRDVNPKIRQKMEILEMNDDFLKDMSVLRKKWANAVKEYNFYFKKIINKAFKKGADDDIKKIIMGGTKPTGDQYTLKDKKEFKVLGEKAYKPLQDKLFNEDVVALCKKYKLFPTSIWKYPIQISVVFGEFFPASNWLTVGLSGFASNKEIMTIPQDLNFAIKIENHKETNEPELFIQIFENTSLGDVEKNWKLIAKEKEKLKGIKDIKKNYYPLKNIEKAKIIKDLRKQGKSDWEIQEEIFGEITDVNFGKIENKRKNSVKQIGYQYGKK